VSVSSLVRSFVRSSVSSLAFVIVRCSLVRSFVSSLSVRRSFSFVRSVRQFVSSLVCSFSLLVR
jgi:hypothetical protein